MDGINGKQTTNVLHDRLMVLSVDPDDDCRLISALTLELDSDISVFSAATGAQALAMLADPDTAFDLILLEAAMPDMDGRDLFARIRRLVGYATTPIIFLTVCALQHEVQALRSLRPAAIIRKPYDVLSLAREVRSCVARPSGDPRG